MTKKKKTLFFGNKDKGAELLRTENHNESSVQFRWAACEGQNRHVLCESEKKKKKCLAVFLPQQPQRVSDKNNDRPKATHRNLKQSGSGLQTINPKSISQRPQNSWERAKEVFLYRLFFFLSVCQGLRSVAFFC